MRNLKLKTEKDIKELEGFGLENKIEPFGQETSPNNFESIKSLYYNDERINHLIPDFLMRLKNQVFDLEKLATEKDLKLTRKMLHKMKGACGSYGFPILYETLLKLEKILAHHDFSEGEWAAEFSLFKKLIEHVEVQ